MAYYTVAVLGLSDESMGVKKQLPGLITTPEVWDYIYQ